AARCFGPAFRKTPTASLHEIAPERWAMNSHDFYIRAIHLFSAFGSLRNLPNTKLYLRPLHVSPAGGVYRNLEIAALLVTLECCTPKNVWGFIQIHSLKFIKGVWSRMA